MAEFRCRREIFNLSTKTKDEWNPFLFLFWREQRRRSFLFLFVPFRATRKLLFSLLSTSFVFTRAKPKFSSFHLCNFDKFQYTYFNIATYPPDNVPLQLRSLVKYSRAYTTPPTLLFSSKFDRKTILRRISHHSYDVNVSIRPVTSSGLH